MTQPTVQTIQADQADEAEARRFVEQWVACFDERDLEGLDRLCHESRPETSREASDKYNRLLFEAGYQVVRWTLAPWKQPAWSIFNTKRFEPPPTHMANVFLKNPDGFTNEVFVAFAQQASVSRSCYYVGIPKRARVTRLDLPAYEGRVTRFIKAAVNKLAKGCSDPVTQVLLSFSVEQGQLTISFDTRPDYEPGDCEKMSHYDFHRLLLPKWTHFVEDGHTVIDGGGRVYTLHDPAKDTATSPAPLAEIIGLWLVRLVREIVDAHPSFDVLLEYSVEEVEGKFGWPAHPDGLPEG